MTIDDTHESTLMLVQHLLHDLHRYLDSFLARNRLITQRVLPGVVVMTADDREVSVADGGENVLRWISVENGRSAH